MLVISIISLIVAILTLVGMVLFVVVGVKGAQADSDKTEEIIRLKQDLEMFCVKNQLLDEAFAEYKKAFPIKSKYRNGARVFIVENKKPYKGTIVEVRQDAEFRIFYTVQYKEEGRSVVKSVNRPQHEIYETLTIAIESEQLITL